MASVRNYPPPFVSMGNAFFSSSNQEGNMMSNNNNNNHHSSQEQQEASSQLVKSKIMVVAVAVLFAAVLFIICLHIYAKWFWRHQGAALGMTRSSSSWRRRRRQVASRPPRSIILDPLAAADHDPQQQHLFLLHSMGLDKTLVESLPTFVYKKAVFPQEIADMSESLSQLQQQELECAVCLEEFEENEMGRTLPKCAHCYHVECIDMWLYSHSNCPLCRASARPNGPAGPAQKQRHSSAASAAAALGAAIEDEAAADPENAAVAATPQGDQQLQSSSRTLDLNLGLSGSSLARASSTTPHEEETIAAAAAVTAAGGGSAPTTDRKSVV